jgi:hypothetical protein
MMRKARMTVATDAAVGPGGASTPSRKRRGGREGVGVDHQHHYHDRSYYQYLLVLLGFLLVFHVTWYQCSLLQRPTMTTVRLYSVMDDEPLLQQKHEPKRPPVHPVTAISSATSATGKVGQEDDRKMHQTSRYKNVPHSTVVLMVISRTDDYLRHRIAALYDAFGDNFLVIWDNNEQESCPTAWLATAVVAATTGGGGAIRCIDQSRQPVSATHQYNYMGLGQERAMMWAMENRHRHDDDRDEEIGLFEHVWFLEDDVEYYPDISALIQVIDATGDVAADLLHQETFANPYYEYNDEEKRRILNETGLPAETEWYHLHIVLNETAEHRPFGDTNITASLFNLFRVSSTFLATMQDFYDTNHQQWTFFEGLLPTLVRHHNLTSALWTDYMLQTHNVSSFLRFRPCFTTMTEPGIYHPVKFRNGAYLVC